jgi:hypothetical protein
MRSQGTTPGTTINERDKGLDETCRRDTPHQIMAQKCMDLQHPDTAGRTSVVRTKQFLSLDEILEIQGAALEVVCMCPVPKWETIYLQNQYYFQTHHPKIYSRIKTLVRDIDAEHWGLLEALEKTVGIGVNARCIEFHEYGLNARRICGLHVDTGSLFTVDIMLSDTSEFEGGKFITDRLPNGDEDVDPKVMLPHNQLHRFQQGDALVFLSHKRHSLTPIKSGTRQVLVLEFWEGSECTGSHRCMNPSCGGEYKEDED